MDKLLELNRWNLVLIRSDMRLRNSTMATNSKELGVNMKVKLILGE
jgi:hypothetical protein